MRLSLLTLPFAAALVRARHYGNIPYKIKDRIPGPPPGWLRRGPAPPDYLLQLKIALPQPHFPIPEKYLWEVSNPKHERYGAHSLKEETENILPVVGARLGCYPCPGCPCGGNAEHDEKRGFMISLTTHSNGGTLARTVVRISSEHRVTVFQRPCTITLS